MVDGFSGWSYVVAFRDTKTSARAIMGHICFFLSVGAPVAFCSDNGNNSVWQNSGFPL